jgi:hypothetical protein
MLGFARLAKAAFFNHFLVFIPDPALKLSSARTSLDSLLRVPHHLDLSRHTASFTIRFSVKKLNKALRLLPSGGRW